MMSGEKKGVISDGVFRIGILIAVLLIVFGIKKNFGGDSNKPSQTLNQTGEVASDDSQFEQGPKICNKFLKTKLDEGDVGKEYNVTVRRDCIAVVIQWPDSGYALDIDPDLGTEISRYALRPKFGHVPNIDKDLNTETLKYVLQKYCFVGPILPRELSSKSYVYWSPKDLMCLTGYNGTVTLKLRKQSSDE